MAFEGYVDHTSEVEVSGWVFDDASPDAAVGVEILAGGKVVGRVVADGFRGDLLAAGKGNGRHAFSFRVGRAVAGGLSARVEGKRWLLPRGGHVVAQRASHLLNHSLEFGLPQVRWGFTEPRASVDESRVLGRVVAAYHAAMRDDPARRASKGDVWSGVREAFHGDLIRLLERRDLSGLGAYLRDGHNRGITFGITQGDVTTAALRSQPAAAAMAAGQFADYLASLAEYLGVLDVESPEQHGQWAENLHSDPDVLVRRIGESLGIEVLPPDVMGSLFGIVTSAGVLSGRDVLALYAALRLREVSRQNGLAAPSVCEIGGGLGGVAYYASRLGVGSHTIIDLPLVNVLQGYYLLRSLPEVPVALYGEAEMSGGVPGAVRILPTWCFEGAGMAVDVLFNMDSFPEMHLDYSTGYLRRAREVGTRLLLSINQEARAPQSGSARQTVVREIAGAVGGYDRQCRFRHWIKPGYVEELYRVRPA
jgi:hypothetical protein